MSDCRDHASSDEPPSALHRILRPFSKVEPGEGLVVVLLLTCVFLILSSYYAMKSSREGLILTQGSFGLSGQELKAYASGVMACLLVAIVPAYGALAARVRRIRLIDVSYALVIASLILFFALARAGLRIGISLFIWIGLVNLFLVAQFWSYANDVYAEAQGKRLFAIIALGGSLGGVIGPWIASLATTENLLIVAAVLLVPCLAIFHIVERIHARDPLAGRVAVEPINSRGGFSLLKEDRYLMMIASLVFVAALVKTIGDYVLSETAAQRAIEMVPNTAHAELAGHARGAAIVADREELIKLFYSDFFFWVNLVSFVLQALLVSRALERFGIRRALFVMPAIALGAYGAIAMIGGFALVRAAKVAENSTDYSIDNTVRQTLFLPTNRAAKYKAKAAIDTFAVRAGDTLSAIVIWICVRQMGFHGRQLAAINIALVTVWLAVAMGVVRSHQRVTRASTS